MGRVGIHSLNIGIILYFLLSYTALFNFHSFAIGIWFDFPYNNEIENGKVRYGVDLDKSLENIIILFTKGPESRIAKIQFSYNIENLQGLDTSELIGREISNPLFKAVSYRLANSEKKLNKYYWFVLIHSYIGLFLIDRGTNKFLCKLESEVRNLVLPNGMLKIENKGGNHIVMCPISPENINVTPKNNDNENIVEFSNPDSSKGRIYGFLFFLTPFNLPKISYAPSDMGLDKGLSLKFDAPYKPSSMYNFLLPMSEYVCSFNKGEFLIWGGFIYQSGEYKLYNRLAMFDVYTLTYKKSLREWQLIFDEPFTGSIRFKGQLSNIGSGILNGGLEDNLSLVPIKCIIKKENDNRREFVIDIPSNQDSHFLAPVLPSIREERN